VNKQAHKINLKLSSLIGIISLSVSYLAGEKEIIFTYSLTARKVYNCNPGVK
jgi:hypothetical protein